MLKYLTNVPLKSLFQWSQEKGNDNDNEDEYDDTDDDV